MLTKIAVTIFIFQALAATLNAADNNSKIVCYYDSKAFGKEGI
jgi:hypothetical protein